MHVQDHGNLEAYLVMIELVSVLPKNAIGADMTARSMTSWSCIPAFLAMTLKQNHVRAALTQRPDIYSVA
jgi:hypothetical protein